MGMSKKGVKKKIRESGLKKSPSSSAAVAEAAEFLARIEKIRRRYSPKAVELTPLQQALAEQIEKSFADVRCLSEPRVLLCGEAEDDYMSREAQAMLFSREERNDWHAIPDDLLFACDAALCYVGPEAYRFLIPRFMIGDLHGVVQIFPGMSYNQSDSLKDYICEQMSLLNEAQQQCLSDFMNLACVNESTGEYSRRSQFLPWELVEYHSHYDEKQVTHREFGLMLVRRYVERVGLNKVSEGEY